MKERVRTTSVVQQIPNSGFTMVEILVVMAIMVVLAVLAMNGIASYGRRQQYLEFVGEVQNGFAEARSKSIAAVDETVYGVYVGTSTVEYFSGTVPAAGSASNTIIAIPSYLSATSSLTGNNWYVTFSRRTGEPSATGTIAISDTRALSTTTITIYSSGLVE